MKNILLYFVGFLFVAACAETKPIVKPREFKQIDVAHLYDSITHYYGNYTTVSARFTAQVTNPKPISFKGTIRIKRDSIIWISITPALNIEAVRCVFTPDSVLVLNRIDKTYYQGGYEIINQLAGISMNFKTIQSVLLNELVFYPFENTIDTLKTFKTYNVSRKKNDVELKNYSYKERRQLSGRKLDSLLTIQSMVIGSDNFRITDIEIEDQAKNLKVQTKYSMFTLQDSLSFPNLLSFEVKAHKKKMFLLIDYNKVEFNIEQAYPFTINTKYKQFLK